tara:strand:- start:15 stop:254 length:240 start_codon:yes stop_codon:yes gene_type:complete
MQTNDKYTVGFALYRAADADENEVKRLIELEQARQHSPSKNDFTREIRLFNHRAKETRALADGLLGLADAEAAAARGTQ